ncbi:hypothetical protein I4I73_21335 [Pseudonocardia sp. KRD-184]|uniref:Uncharacterized protein n=1 Tax=Pseudonocardia oceani TaxID=2792013 RepID=A0ABS6UK19_9PSEU|nr:hypothetical protein [Pseudonocardia oceani]MBW0090512.1 hypothetical protein [Pseudonocardia oceani]MBW0098535.1 hypothetical protein [Pseudonocardia oceani]MBW0124375.1 hypothetical protein [Pseudonocardia oceani]MBW0131145.1 hypothetical protein [Pseudonocardia oceani]MBW0132593.1 hypothetical protein [Pseudonocardia oceani]
MTDTTAGCGCQYDATGLVFVDRCVCLPVPVSDDQAALDRAAADMAVRDDLAREVARLWVAADKNDPRDLTAALDRLAAAYGEDR